MKIKRFEDGKRNAEQVISETSSWLEMWSGRKHVTVPVKMEWLELDEVISIMDEFSV